MNNILAVLQQWNLDTGKARWRMYRAPTPRERERWHTLWLSVQGWTASQIAVALGRNPHTVGSWLADFRQRGPISLTFKHTGGSPPSSTGSSKLS